MSAQAPNPPKSETDVSGVQAGWPRVREEVQLVGDQPFRMAGSVHVFEDGVEQPGATLVKEDQPASIFIMIDVSSSMKNSAAAVITAAQKLVAASDPADEIGIISFSWPAYIDQTFTTDKAQLGDTLRGIQFVQSGTALFDALQATVGQFAREGAKYRRVILVFSDGQDTASNLSLAKLLKSLHSPDGPVIDTLAPNSDGNGKRTLEAISKATGGLEFRAGDAAMAAQDIDSGYRLEYTSTHTQRDGKLHKIEVKLEAVARASKPMVIYRQEYYAPLQ